MNKPLCFLSSVLCLLVVGCAQYGAVTGAIRVNGAEIADKELDAAVYVLCRGITVGAWVRRFGNNQESAQAWKAICIETAATTPAKETP